MKRLLSISLVAVACAALVSPDPAYAGKWKDKWKEKHGKKGKKGKGKGKGKHDDDDDDGGHDDDDDGGGGGGGGGSTGRAKIEGAGQRGVASFGGKVVDTVYGPRGAFVLDIHPIAPAGSTLSVACRFIHFENFVVAGNRVTFRGRGGCRVLRTDGTIMMTQNVNDFEIIDNPGGDQIDVDFVGETGFGVPGGALEFGDLTVTPAS